METSNLFSAEELARYSRHILIPGFGLEAQEKLKNARVLVIGAGGLGSPLLLYLAAAGVGHIGIADGDLVDDSNLQRQVLFSVDHIGKAKVEAAKERLQSLNPYITVQIYCTQLTSANALEIIKDYDIVADGTDNFPARYLVNDACVLLDKPNVYASIFQFEGQVSVFNKADEQGNRGPNYRDLYPEPPEPGAVQNCSEAGVLGVLPGIIGSLQALEVIKLITGLGSSLSGRLYTFDALDFESRTYTVKKSPDNPLNGLNPSITSLTDYRQFCGFKDAGQVFREVSPTELVAWQEEGIDLQIVDVREPFEYELVNIGGHSVPLSDIPQLAGSISKEKKVIVMCKSGGRSSAAIKLLQDNYGYHNLYNLKGGILNYIAELEKDLPVY